MYKDHAWPIELNSICVNGSNLDFNHSLSQVPTTVKYGNAGIVLK